MKEFNKRKSLLALVVIILIVALLLIGCPTKTFAERERLVVEFIDVGQGDATLISLPDGKTMLIDTGENPKSKDNIVIERIKKYTSTIDYLVLTHPDNAHISNMVNLFDELTIKKAYLPKILNPSLFSTFSDIYNQLIERNIPTEINQMYLNLSTDEYTLLFLSPILKGENSSYSIFNSSSMPTGDMIDNLSPIIFLEYKGVRFIFSGDADKTQEQIVLEQNYNNFYSMRAKREINLSDVDFYKLSSHGNDKGNSMEFLSLLKPKNAVISVGGINNENCPSIFTLKRLQDANFEHNLFRTDVDRTIVVEVNVFGKYEVKRGIR